MTKTSQTYLLIAVLIIVSAVGGLSYLYNETQKISEQEAIASLNHGIKLFREDKFAESLEEFESIPDGILRDWHLPYYTASAHVMLKNYKLAIPFLEEALELNPKETLVLFELGVVYYKVGNLSLSKAYFASVLEIDPTNEEARGLMDIMANLERQQPGAAQEKTSKEGDTGEEGH